MSKKIKVAVIGVGRWGVHLLRNFLVHPLAEVVAVVDPTPDCLTRVKQQFNLDKNIFLTTDFSELKQIPDLEAVVIATPATTHYSLIHDALKQGYHVLAEKPLTLDPKECLELCHLADYQKRQLMVDHTYLFHPAVERGRAIVRGSNIASDKGSDKGLDKGLNKGLNKGSDRSSELGDLRYGYATRTHLGPVRQDVDAMWDLAIHDIAIFNTWLGLTPVKVQATGTIWLQPGLSDLVWVTLTYATGFQAYIHLCWSNPDKQRRLGVVGSAGTLIFDEMSPQAPLTLLRGEFERQQNLFIPVNQKSEVLQIGTTEPLQGVCHEFLESVINNSPCEVSSGWVGAELVKILAGLRESLNQGGICVHLENFH